jgi:pantoate--beta-alanine ligase
MGALHEGHLSLVRRARAENDAVGVSIFVNPKQFNNAGDLASYPRTPDVDLRLLEAHGVDLVWTPGESDVYPEGYQTSVAVGEIAKPLEGSARPGHFQGVTTVVAKIFNVFHPHRAYFGEKDAQQVAVVRRMVLDLDFNVQIMACPTVREADGLAISSRNKNLSPEGRRQAICLFEALMTANTAFKAGVHSAAELKRLMRDVIRRYDRARIDYLSVANVLTLQEVEAVDDQALLSMAVFVDEVRLIDNITIGK